MTFRNVLLSQALSQVQLHEGGGGVNGYGSGNNTQFMYELPAEEVEEDIMASQGGMNDIVDEIGASAPGEGIPMGFVGGGSGFYDSQAGGSGTQGGGIPEYMTPVDPVNDKENIGGGMNGLGRYIPSPGSLPPVGIKRRRAIHASSGRASQMSTQQSQQSQSAWLGCLSNSQVSSQPDSSMDGGASQGEFRLKSVIPYRSSLQHKGNGVSSSGFKRPMMMMTSSQGTQGTQGTANGPGPARGRNGGMAVGSIPQSPGALPNPFRGDAPGKGAALTTRLVNTAARMPSRYRRDFHEVGELGKGNFSRVFKCVGRLDGADYAVKQSRQPFIGESDRRQAIGEVQALAAAGSHPHLVRYFSAWEEDSKLHVQLELCDQGSLASRRDVAESAESEEELLRILQNIGGALDHLHKAGIAHMDVKPDNIYISSATNAIAMSKMKINDGNNDSNMMIASRDGDSDGDGDGDPVVYKLGDLGSAVVLDGSNGVLEGDCRYLPLEILNDDYGALDKADVWALGASVYELAREGNGGSPAGPLPKEGPHFHALRHGKLTLLPRVSNGLMTLLKAMMANDPKDRPSAAEVVARADKLMENYCNGNGGVLSQHV